MKFQTEVISNELNPVWNFTGEIDGFMDGDVLRFTVMDKDTFPKPDDFLGKAELTAQDFYSNGFQGELTLADSKTQATLSVMVVVVGCNEAAPELAEGEGVQMTVSSEFVEGIMVAGSSSAAVYSADAVDGSTMMGSSSALMYSGIPAGGTSAGGVVVSSSGSPGVSEGGVVVSSTGAPCSVMHGLPVYAPGVITTTTAPRHSMTYSAPQTYSVPQTYSAPQVPMNGMVTTNNVESQSMANHPITYAAAQAPLSSQSVVPTGKVVVHPPVTVTAEEFAKINGSMTSEPLPVTVGMETVGVETNREVVVSDTEAVDKTVKIKKKRKSQQCC